MLIEDTNHRNDDRIIRALELLTAQVWSLRQQNERFEQRLAFAMPTDSDIRNEVDRFITSARAVSLRSYLAPPSQPVSMRPRPRP